jgi:hypothetical protein
MFGLLLSSEKQNVCQNKVLRWSLDVVGTSGRGVSVGSGNALQAVRLRVRFSMVSLVFFIDIQHYGPDVDSASNRNGYQIYFLGIKTAGT